MWLLTTILDTADIKHFHLCAYLLKKPVSFELWTMDPGPLISMTTVKIIVSHSFLKNNL